MLVPRYKYSEQLLRQVVAESRNMAEVLRRLRVSPNGGTHTHLRRRIREHGIDTSHFCRTPSYLRGRRASSPAEVLILRDPMRRRAHPEVLRRALLRQGVPPICASCGTGETWNGRPLTLHVDHIDGCFWDCRQENLRLLCPNCHSQTDTYAGRNRARLAERTAAIPRQSDSMSATDAGAARTDGQATDPQESVTALLHRIETGELTTTEVARRIGRHRNQVHRLRRQLREQSRQPRLPRGADHADSVIRYALANPDLGPRRIAAALRDDETGAPLLSHGTVSNILRAAGLNTSAARRSRLVTPAGVAEAADAAGLGPAVRKDVGVQVPSPAQEQV